MSLVLGCCREIISNGPTRFLQGGGGGGGGGGDVDVVNNNKRSLMMISSSIEKEINNNHLSCFSVDPTDFSSSSSTIGGDSDDDLDDDEFTSSNVSQNKFSMDSLEESLPIKRGLSNFFSGRSKSFANLSEATTLKSLAKTENPFNKRRRTLMACKMSRNRKKSYYTSAIKIISPVSMPLLKLNEDDDDDDAETESESEEDEQQVRMKMNNNINNKEGDEEVDSREIEHQEEEQNGKMKRFKAPRCFSLTDLHHHQLKTSNN